MKGPYLLDTAALLLLMGEAERVPPTLRKELSAPEVEIFYSQISTLEIQIK